jgi:hypothetical protein
MADDQTRSVLDHQHKEFGRHTGVGVQHAKLVTTRLIKFHMGGEPARLVSFRGQREGQPLASLLALHTQKSIGSTVVRTLDSHGLEGPGRVR